MSLGVELSFTPVEHPFPLPRVVRHRLNASEIVMDRHILGYRYEGDGIPVLRYLDLATGEYVEVDLTSIGSFELSLDPRRFCVGRYRASPGPCGRPLEEDWPLAQCSGCLQEFVRRPDCVFAPRCSPDQCTMEACRRSHSVYLAFFGDRVKMGMTSTARLNERMLEQGVDAHVHLCTTPSRPSARTIEHAISQHLGITERIRAPTFLKSLERPFDILEATGVYERLRGKLTGVIMEQAPAIERDWSGSVEIVMDGPVLNPRERTMRNVRRPPNPLEQGGEVVWVRGKYLFYRRGGLYAMRLDKLASHLASLRFG